LEPLDYFPFVYLMSKSHILLTDSGGIQEEATALKKPILVMRDTTERPETLNLGFVKLVGTNYDLIVNEVFQLLNKSLSPNDDTQCVSPYGDGKAAEKIVKILSNVL